MDGAFNLPLKAAVRARRSASNPSVLFAFSVSSVVRVSLRPHRILSRAAPQKSSPGYRVITCAAWIHHAVADT